MMEGLSAEGANSNVRSALHSADDPPFLCSCPFLVSMFAVGPYVLWVLCGPSKATARCYTSICDGIISNGATAVCFITMRTSQSPQFQQSLWSQQSQQSPKSPQSPLSLQVRPAHTQVNLREFF